MTKKSNNGNNLVTISCIAIVVIGLLVYFLFIRNNSTPSVAADKESLEKVNAGLRNLVYEQISLNDFQNKAKEYCTDNLINKLTKYYNNDSSSVCLDVAGCSVDGGYIGNSTDIYYREFKIGEVKADTVEATGLYGESANDAKSQKITYKLENGKWKLDDFDIIDYR